MTQAAVSARATEPQAAQQHDEYTYFVCIDDEHESKIARAYVAARYPRTKARLTREVPIMRVSDRVVIIPLIRGEDRSALSVSGFNERGIPYTQHRTPSELIGEVRECQPMAVRDYWTGRSDQWDAFGGEVDKARFMAALAASVSPIMAKVHVGADTVVKLTFI